MNYRDVAKRLKKLGCQELSRRSRGSHRKWYNPATERATVVPDWAGKDLKPGTVRAVVRQLGIDWKEFEQT
jgi:predicted RNA binding protein YcfA (HicA-like mRNA interferase family)